MKGVYHALGRLWGIWATLRVIGSQGSWVCRGFDGQRYEDLEVKVRKTCEEMNDRPGRYAYEAREIPRCVRCEDWPAQENNPLGLCMGCDRDDT